jgi:NADH dehydrogenase
MIALVTGATGFLGREVVRALSSRDVEVRCLVRSPGRERLMVGQRVDVHYGNVGDPAALRAAFHNVDVVVHLVAVIREKADVTFQTVNARGTQNVVEAARNAGVGHFVQMSAIGAADDPRYPYLRSKWQAEQAIKDSGLPYTILRASLMFGEGDEPFNTVAGLVRAFPLVPIPGPGTNRFQPMAVDEVAHCIADAAGREDLKGQVIEVGGPEQLTYNEIVSIIARTCRVWRLRVHIPVALMRPVVRLMEVVLPRPPVTTQQMGMLPVPNVAEADTVERVFGFKPRPLEGNIDYVKKIKAWDGIRISLGFMPKWIRDH